MDKSQLFGEAELGSPRIANVSAVNKAGWTWRVALAGAATVIGWSIPVGYTIGVVNAPASIIRQWCNESVYQHYSLVLSDSGLDGLWSSIVSIFLIGGMIGSLSGALIADKVGRKGSLVISVVMLLVSAIMFIFSKHLNSVEIIFIARIIIGFGSGLITTVMPMYLTEIAPINLKGAVGTFCPLGLCSGVVIAQFLGWPEILGTSDYWSYLLGCYAILVITGSLALPFLSESPKYLYSVRGLRQKAILELAKLRGQPNDLVCAELDDKEDETEAWSITKLLKNKQLRIKLLLVVALQGGQQCSGINAVFYYSTDIFKSAGLSPDAAKYASLGAALLNFVVSVIMIPIINNFSRRTLSIVSCGLSTVFLVLLSFCITYMNVANFMPFLSIACVFGYIISYDIGLGPIPFFIGSELFDIAPRPAAMALGSVANWSGNFFVGMFFLPLKHLIGAYSFLIFATSTGLLTLFLKMCLPETNAKVLAESKTNE